MKLTEYLPYLRNAIRFRFITKKQISSQHEPLNCVISLTSIPSRLKTLHLTVASLLLQEQQARQIVLWLNGDLKGRIPSKLMKLEGERFTIVFRDQYSSHRKLVFALQEYPNDVVITCDDDMLYHKTWLGSLYRDHQRFPSQIIAHE